MVTDKERLASLETSIHYIVAKVDDISVKVADLTAFKLKLIGAATLAAAIVSSIITVYAR